MAIEIIPKPKVKKTPWLNIVIGFCLGLFLALLVSYFILDIKEKKLSPKLTELEKSLARTPSEELLEKEIFNYQKKINDFALLFSRHRLIFNLFNFLEKTVHPRVWFSKFKFETNSNLVEISGQADNFEVLGQQLLIFKGQDFVKEIKLSEVSLTKEGEVRFSLKLIFDPKIFASLTQ